MKPVSLNVIFSYCIGEGLKAHFVDLCSFWIRAKTADLYVMVKFWLVCQAMYVKCTNPFVCSCVTFLFV